MNNMDNCSTLVGNVGGRYFPHGSNSSQHAMKDGTLADQTIFAWYIKAEVRQF